MQKNDAKRTVLGTHVERLAQDFECETFLEIL